MKFYTGVGSRNTPADVLALMARLACKLRVTHRLRSGGAIGADSAFERGAAGVADVFLAKHATPEAIAIAAKFHPAWHRCKGYVQKLHGRNTFQVLGADLATPSSFLVCWTRDGAISHTDRCYNTGGTGTAISIADAHGVPVFNLARHDHRVRVEGFLSGGQ
ncbi:MAG: hypothetical protein JEZ11_03955 [Desulfobacterales bacterium]|nr:hypothetical protein [Desulfobacterales bacterium]